jgi:hypothetical protein
MVGASVAGFLASVLQRRFPDVRHISNFACNGQTCMHAYVVRACHGGSGRCLVGCPWVLRANGSTQPKGAHGFYLCWLRRLMGILITGAGSIAPYRAGIAAHAHHVWPHMHAGGCRAAVSCARAVATRRVDRSRDSRVAGTGALHAHFILA